MIQIRTTYCSQRTYSTYSTTRRVDVLCNFELSSKRFTIIYLDGVIGFSFFSLKKGIITIDTRREVGILHVVSYKVSYLLQGVRLALLLYWCDRKYRQKHDSKTTKSVYKFKMINRSSRKRNAHTKHVRSLAKHKCIYIHFFLFLFFLFFLFLFLFLLLLFARPFELD